MDNRLALNYVLAERGGVCAVIKKMCCTYINTTGQVEEDIQKIDEQAQWLHAFGKGNPVPAPHGLQSEGCYPT